MRKLTRIFLLVLLLSALRYPLSAAYGAVPHLINYQGRLTDTSGKPLEGSYAVTFRIYDAETVGSMLWEETHAGVVIQKGIFSVLLGSVTNLGLAFDKQYYLEIKVGTEVMSPRQRITSAGYAVRAEKAEAVSGSENIFPSTGNVGIGTTSPTAKLDIGGESTLKLTPRSSLPSSAQEGMIFYHLNDKKLYVYTGSSGWKMIATLSINTSYPDEKTYGCGGGCNLGTRVHYTWQNVEVPSSINRLRVKYEWYSSNTGYDYYSHNIQVLVNGNAVESFTTYQTIWTQRDNTYNVSSSLYHNGSDTIKIQLTDTGANEEDNYGFRNVYFEFSQ